MLLINLRRLSLLAPTAWNSPHRSSLRQVKQSYRAMSASSADHSDLSPLAKVKPLAAVVQMSCTGDIEANYGQGRDLIVKAAKQGARMVFLPECFDFVCERKATMEALRQCDGVILPRYQELAKQHQVWLSLGGYHKRVGCPALLLGGYHKKTAETVLTGRISNTHVIVDSEGCILGRYSKTHLFDVDIKGGVRLKETDMTIPGTRIHPPVSTPVGRVGMAICYDMRFPEMSTALTQQGAHILTFPSAFTIPTGLAHWEVLLRSRAIENQCYVIAAAQVGQHHPKRSSYGHAMIVDPWGCVVAECSDKVGLALAEIDLDYLEKRRIEMPVQTHRRHDLYGHIQLQQACDIDGQSTYRFGQHTVKSDQVFYRTPLSFAFVNRKPVVPGHVLVSPIEPVKRFEGLSAAQVADLFTCVQKVSTVMEKHHGCSSVTVGLQDGPEAGQSVWHVHVHILPRKKGDFEENDDIYKELQRHDKDMPASDGTGSGGWRSDADMAAEAATLRKLFS